MNRQFNTSSKLTRTVLAVAAIVATWVIALSIDGLAGHYHVAAQAANSPMVTLAQR
jgi:hypothetical protein